VARPAHPGFAFCPRCRKSLAPAPPATPAPSETDRRTVTVLFADLSGFTGLSERLDPEDVRALQSELFSEMAAAIERYGGFAEKYVGDAVMAVFGAPAAHEDDPERARARYEEALPLAEEAGDPQLLFPARSVRARGRRSGPSQVVYIRPFR